MNHQPAPRRPVTSRKAPAHVLTGPGAAAGTEEPAPAPKAHAETRAQPATDAHGDPDAPAARTEAQAGPEGLDARFQERTADLQRVKAEYDNYRKRVQRDRLAVREIAVANVLTGLLPVLDAIANAREHGEVSGGFHHVTEALETQLAALGLETFGRPGDPFDPALHNALTHAHTDQVDRPTCTGVLRSGYRVGGHLLRPAEVTVAEPLPMPPTGPPAGASAESPGSGTGPGQQHGDEPRRGPRTRTGVSDADLRQ